MDAEVLQELADAGAEKWAARARGGQAPDARSPAAVAPACATGAAGLGGALYTGRGPVCGTIMRGAGVCGACVVSAGGGAAGRGATAGACSGAAEATAAGGAGGAAGGGAGRATGAAVTGGVIAGAAGLSREAGTGGFAGAAQRRRRGNWRSGRRRYGLRRRRRTTGFGNGGGAGRARRWRHRFFLLRDCLENISGPGDVRQIDLGLDFFFAARRAGGSGGRRLCFAGGAEVAAYFFCFVLFQRTGMRLLLSHPDHRQHVENGFALDFQLPGEIVDSNLAHPAFLLPRAVLKSSSRPHGVSCFDRTLPKSVRASTVTLSLCLSLWSSSLFLEPADLPVYWKPDRLRLMLLAPPLPRRSPKLRRHLPPTFLAAQYLTLRRSGTSASAATASPGSRLAK